MIRGCVCGLCGPFYFVILIRMDVKFHPFIAIGKITLLQGDPGDGKSTIMMNLIAELSTGGKTPDGCKIGAPQKVIYQCSEDGVSDTIKPRLERCGADCGKIAFINEEVYNGLTLDDERIRQAIIEFRPRLVVIDPIQAYLGSDSDLQIAGRARKLMRRLGMWAAGYDCAIVLIGHLNKKEGSIAITPCAAEHPMSFKVPDRLLTDGQCRMMINGIQFIQVLLEANGLAAGKDHQFKGRYDAEKNAVVISLEENEFENECQSKIGLNL